MNIKYPSSRYTPATNVAISDLPAGFPSMTGQGQFPPPKKGNHPKGAVQMKSNNPFITLYQDPLYIEAGALLSKIDAAYRKEVANEETLKDKLFVVLNNKQDALDIAISIADGGASNESADLIRNNITESRAKQAVLSQGLEKQRKAIEHLASQLSYNICQGQLQAHIAAVKRAVQVLGEFKDALAVEGGIRNAIENAGYSCFLQPFFFNGIGEQGEDHASYFLREANHYIAVNDGKLSTAKKVSGLVLCDIYIDGVKKEAGTMVELDEITADKFTYEGSFDAQGKALPPKSNARSSERIFSN